MALDTISIELVLNREIFDEIMPRSRNYSWMQTSVKFRDKKMVDVSGLKIKSVEAVLKYVRLTKSHGINLSNTSLNKNMIIRLVNQILDSQIAVEVLKLSKNEGIDNETLKVIAMLIEHKTPLSSLNLSKTQVDQHGLTALLSSCIGST